MKDLSKVRPILGRQHGAAKGSQYQGVAWDEGSNKWRAQIQVDLGKYDDEYAAAICYAAFEPEFRALGEQARREAGDRRHLGGISQGRLIP